MKILKYIKIALIIVFSLFLCQSALANNNLKRVVSLAPSITDTLVALGYGKNIVAMSSYCTMQDSINKEVKRVGVGNAYNAELVLSLKPDLVLGLDENQHSFIPYHTIKTLSYNDIIDSYLQIAKLMGDKARGQKLYDESQYKINAIREELKLKPKQKILIVINREKAVNGLLYQVTAAGSDLYFNDLINTLNLINALDTTEAYPILNFEQLQKINPDIIIDLVYPENKDILTLADWQDMPLKAVQNNKVLISHIGMVPGPKSLLFLDEIADVLL